MTTPPPNDRSDDPERPLSAADEARVRRLLADARVASPTPADVVARLDQTLASLTAEQAATQPGDAPGEVLDLAARRRRRVTGLLAAAAAVVVIGVGVGELVGVDSPESADSGSGTSLNGAEEKAVTAPDDSRPEYGADDADSAEDQERGGLASKRAAGRELLVRGVDIRTPRVRPDHLRDDVLHLRRTLLPADDGALYRRGVLLAPRGFSCRPGAWGEGILVGVRFSGHRAVVAFRPPTGESQVVDVLPCGDGQPLRTLTVRAPS